MVMSMLHLYLNSLSGNHLVYPVIHLRHDFCCNFICNTICLGRQVRRIKLNLCCRLPYCTFCSITDLDFRKEGGIWKIFTHTVSEDGRCVDLGFAAGDQEANNIERMTAMIHTQVEKTYGGYKFSIGSVSAEDGLPFMSASSLNGIRREIAESLDTLPCGKKDILLRELKKTQKTALQKDVPYKANVSNRLALKLYQEAGAETVSQAYELSHHTDAATVR